MEELFTWLRHNSPEELTEELVFLLQQTLAELPPGPLRREVIAVLESGSLPWERVWSWPDRYRHLRSDLALLLEELHDLAGQMPDSRWQNTRWRRFCRCRASQLALDSLQSEIEAAWDEYMQNPIGSQEVTAESVAGHRLLVEGLAAWMEAIELARQWPDDPAALVQAEQGNRLLTVLADFSKRLKSRCRQPD